MWKPLSGREMLKSCWQGDISEVVFFLCLFVFLNQTIIWVCVFFYGSPKQSYTYMSYSLCSWLFACSVLFWAISKFFSEIKAFQLPFLSKDKPLLLFSPPAANTAAPAQGGCLSRKTESCLSSFSTLLVLIWLAYSTFASVTSAENNHLLLEYGAALQDRCGHSCSEV